MAGRDEKKDAALNKVSVIGEVELEGRIEGGKSHGMISFTLCATEALRNWSDPRGTCLRKFMRFLCKAHHLCSGPLIDNAETQLSQSNADACA